MISISSAACGDDGGGADSGGSSTTGGPGTTEGASTTSPATADSSGGSGSGSATTGDGTATAADTTATSADDTSTAGDTTAAADGSSGSTTGDPTTAGSTEGSTTEVGMGSLDAAISNLEVFQNCQPIVPLDPVNVSFTLELTNPGDGPASATVSSATFLDVGGMPVATVDVVPDAFGPIDAGDSEMTIVNKVADSLMPANGCETLQCGGLYSLELVLDVDGVEVTASDTTQVGCVF